MSQAQAVFEARRSVVVEDQAAFRAAAAQHQRAVLDGAEAGKFMSATAPASLPEQSQADFTTFVKSLSESDAESYASLLKRVQAAARPAALPHGFEQHVSSLKDGCDLIGEVYAIVRPALRDGNMQALRAYLSDLNKADSVLALRADTLLKAAAPALQLAHTQLANAKPDSNGDVFIDLPVFCELNAEGALKSPKPSLSLIKATSRMHAKYLPQLEQLVHNAEKERLVCAARLARRSDRTADEMEDGEVVALAEEISDMAQRLVTFAMHSMNPTLLQSFTMALLDAGCTDQALALGRLARDLDDFIAAHLTADGVAVAKPQQLLEDANGAILKLIGESYETDEQYRRLAIPLTLALADATAQHALCARLPPRHMPAIMAEFGWDFQEAARAAPVADVQEQFKHMREAAEIEDAVVVSQAAVAQQLAELLQDHTELFISEEAHQLSKGTQRFLAAAGSRATGTAALLDLLAQKHALEKGSAVKPSELRANALKLKETLLQPTKDSADR